MDNENNIQSDLTGDLDGKNLVNSIYSTEDRRNTNTNNTAPKSGYYRSKDEIDGENLGEAIIDTTIRDPQRESEYRQGESKIKDMGRMIGMTGESQTGARSTLNKMYETQSAELHNALADAKIGNQYRAGNHITGNVFNDYMNNVSLLNKYLENNGIRNAKSLTYTEIRTALRTGKLHRDGSGMLDISNNEQLKAVLAEKARLTKLEGSAAAMKSRGKLRQTGSEWLKKTYENSDAGAGIKIAKTGARALKTTAKVSKLAVKTSIKTAGNAVLNTALLPVNMVNNAHRSILKVKIAGKQNFIKGDDTAGKLVADKTKLETLNARHEKIKSIKMSGSSKINSFTNDPLKIKAVKANHENKMADRAEKRAEKAVGRSDAGFDKKSQKIDKKIAKSSDMKKDKYNSKKDKLSTRKAKHHKKLANRTSKKFSNTKVGKVITAPIKFKRKKSELFKAIKKKALIFIASTVGVIFVAGLAGFGLCALFAENNTNDSEAVHIRGEDAIIDLSDEDANTLGNFLSVMPDDSDCYRYIDTDWAQAPVAQGTNISTAKAIYSRLKYTRTAYLQNLLYANSTSAAASYGIPQSWYDQIIGLDNIDMDENPNFRVSDVSGNVIGFDFRKFWGPAVEHDGVPLNSDDFRYNENIDFENDYGRTDENSELIISAQPGISNINVDLADESDEILYDSNDGTLIDSITTSSSAVNMGTNTNVTAGVLYEDGGDEDTMFTSMMVVTQLVVGGGRSQETYINYYTTLFNLIMADARIDVSYEVVNDTSRNIFFNWNNRRFTTVPAKKVITDITITFPYSSIVNIYNNYAGNPFLNTVDYVGADTPLSDLVEPAYVPTEDDYGISADEFHNKFGDYRSCAYYFFYDKLGENARAYFYMD